MEPTFTVFQVRQEQYRDLLREASIERLVRSAGLDPQEDLLSIAYERASDRVRGLCRWAPLKGLQVCALPASG